MKHRIKTALAALLLPVLVAVLVLKFGFGRTDQVPTGTTLEQESFLDSAIEFFGGEPEEVRRLREMPLTDTEEGYYEYYFTQLSDEEKRCYREMLAGIRSRNEQFYLTLSGNAVNHVYNALLKDHPELFWVHNREHVYKTTYEGRDYSRFTPGYTYTGEEMSSISASMEAAFQQVSALVPDGASDYEIVKTVYTYLIDTTEYVASEDDQNIAGVFWRRQAVCAGYARAVKYLLDRFGIPCVYVEGEAGNSSEGHAWNIVEIDGLNYYVDTTNGDQPDFLEGTDVMLAEHKTTVIDYLCPFPEEYETCYTPEAEFDVPACYAHDKNFYVLNNACFDVYDWNAVYALCRLRIDNNAAVIRFKFSNQEAFDAALADWNEGSTTQEVAQYYMQRNGLQQVEYHCGVLDNFKTLYYIF